MARVQYTFTFTNAQAGAVVNFGDVPVYSSATDTAADGPRLPLDSANSVTVWSDAATLTATTRDGRGEAISATATRANPTVTDADGNTPTGGPFLRQADASAAYASMNPVIASVVLDADGNRTSWTENGIACSATYDAATGNMLTLTVNGVTRTFTYDANGNMTAAA